jgi:hypothetical protein
MQLLDQFITQTGKQPPDWTSEDMQRYLDYIQAHVTEVIEAKRRDN